MYVSVKLVSVDPFLTERLEDNTAFAVELSIER